MSFLTNFSVSEIRVPTYFLGLNLTDAGQNEFKILKYKFKEYLKYPSENYLHALSLVDAINATKSYGLQESMLILSTFMEYLRNKFLSSDLGVVEKSVTCADVLVKNCGYRIHNQVNKKLFIKTLSKVARKYLSMGEMYSGLHSCRKIGVYIMDTLQAWGEAFQARKALYPQIYGTYLNLKLKYNIQFIRPDFDPTRVPIFLGPISRLEHELQCQDLPKDCTPPSYTLGNELTNYEEPRKHSESYRKLNHIDTARLSDHMLGASDFIDCEHASEAESWERYSITEWEKYSVSHDEYDSENEGAAHPSVAWPGQNYPKTHEHNQGIATTNGRNTSTLSAPLPLESDLLIFDNDPRVPPSSSTSAPLIQVAYHSSDRGSHQHGNLLDLNSIVPYGTRDVQNKDVRGIGDHHKLDMSDKLSLVPYERSQLQPHEQSEAHSLARCDVPFQPSQCPTANHQHQNGHDDTLSHTLTWPHDSMVNEPIRHLHDSNTETTAAVLQQHHQLQHCQIQITRGIETSKHKKQQVMGDLSMDVSLLMNALMTSHNRPSGTGTGISGIDSGKGKSNCCGNRYDFRPSDTGTCDGIGEANCIGNSYSTGICDEATGSGSCRAATGSIGGSRNPFADEVSPSAVSDVPGTDNHAIAEQAGSDTKRWVSHAESDFEEFNLISVDTTQALTFSMAVHKSKALLLENDRQTDTLASPKVARNSRELGPRQSAPESFKTPDAGAGPPVINTDTLAIGQDTERHLPTPRINNRPESRMGRKPPSFIAPASDHNVEFSFIGTQRIVRQK